MSLFVLDTDIFTLFCAGDARVEAHVLSRRRDELAVSVITIDETLRGWYTLIRRVRTPAQIAAAYQGLADTVSSLSDFQMVSFTLAAISRFDSLRSLRLRVRASDLRIAAIVLELGATLVTRNAVDFQQVPGLTVVDWSV